MFVSAITNNEHQLLGGEIIKGRIFDSKIDSKHLCETINFIVYVPANFSPLYTYMTLIALDGNDYFQFGKLPKILDELLFKQVIPNTIVIGIPYNEMKERFVRYHPSGFKHNAFIRFLGEELVPYIDNKFPTFQIGLSRVLIGESLAGTASLLTALTYPHTFGRVIMQSPFVNTTILKKIQLSPSLQLPEIYHVIGNNETQVRTTDGTICNFLLKNRLLKSILQQKEIYYYYDEFYGDHSWIYWQADLKRALRSMLRY